MTTKDEALALALEALEKLWLLSDQAGAIAGPAITAIKQAITPETGNAATSLASAITAESAANAVSHPQATKPAVKESLTTQDIDTCRQWFDSVQDTNGGYLTPADYVLADKIYRTLGMRVPSSITNTLTAVPEAKQ